MKKTAFVFMLIASCWSVAAFAQRNTYFREDFGGQAIHKDYWDADSSEQFTNHLFFQNLTSAGGDAPEAKIGYEPASGMADVLNGTFRLISKPFETQAAPTYVTLKYYYAADKRSLKANRSFGVVARKGNGEWVTCASIDSLPMRIPATVMCARLPEDFEGAEDVQVAVQLMSTRDNRQFVFVIDDIEFFSLPTDAYAARLNLLSSLNVGGVRPVLEFAMKNVGNTMQKSFTFSYVWNDGPAYTRTYELSSDIGIDETVLVALRPEGWDSTAYGSHKLDIWVSAVDGTPVAESAWHKRTYTFHNVAESDMFAKKIIAEQFSSATCSPCEVYNTQVFNPVFEALGSEVVLVKYQMDFPGSGDKYYRPEGGARKAYYGVNSAPSLAVEGKLVSLPTYAANATLFMNYMRERMDGAGKAFFNIVFDTLAVDSTSKRLKAVYRLETKGNLANARLQTAVLERETTGNRGSNGEQSFHHIMMAMTPGVGSDGHTGAVVNLVADTVYEFRYTVDLANTHVEEYDDLLVACFIQNEDGTMEQAAIQDVICTADGLANESACGYAPLAVYPNPASDQVCLQGLSSAEVEVCDLAGRRRFVRTGIDGDYTLDVRDWQPGLYIVKVREGHKVSVARLSVVR